MHFSLSEIQTLPLFKEFVSVCFLIDGPLQIVLIEAGM